MSVDDATLGGTSPSTGYAVVHPGAVDPLEHEPVDHADEPGDVLGGGPLERPLGRVELLECARPHHRETIPERECLDLVVRHVDGGELEAAVELVDLRPHEVAEPRVQVGQGLVEEHDVRPRDEASGERDALLLAARELRRIPVEEPTAVDERRDLLDPLGRLRSIDASRLRSG